MTEQKIYDTLKNNINAFYLTFGMIGGSNEAYYKHNLITKNLNGIYFGDTNRPDLENKIFYVYEGVIPRCTKEFFNSSEAAYTIYKEEKNGDVYYILVFTVLNKYIHDYNNFKNNKAEFASSNYMQKLKQIFCTSFAAIKYINDLSFNKNQKRYVKKNKDMIFNLYDVPIKRTLDYQRPLLFFFFLNINTELI